MVGKIIVTNVLVILQLGRNTKLQVNTADQFVTSVWVGGGRFLLLHVLLWYLQWVQRRRFVGSSSVGYFRNTRNSANGYYAVLPGDKLQT